MSPMPIVIERDATRGRPVWRVYVRDKMTGQYNPLVRHDRPGTRQGVVHVSPEGDAHPFTRKADAESAAHIVLRYTLKMGDMLFAHCRYTEK